MTHAIPYVLGLITGNFLYMALTNRQWGKAVEVSYFQVLAVLLYAYLWGTP